MKITTSKTPNKESKTIGSRKFPSDTKVAGLATIKPLLLKPTKAMKAPSPALIIYLMSLGIASIIIFRNGERLITAKIIPAKNITSKAACHEPSAP